MLSPFLLCGLGRLRTPSWVIRNRSKVKLPRLLPKTRLPMKLPLKRQPQTMPLQKPQKQTLAPKRTLRRSLPPLILNSVTLVRAGVRHEVPFSGPRFHRGFGDFPHLSFF